MLKKLPIGIQSIRVVLEGGYAYVDKTADAKQLIDHGKYYFMSRPRRFGKSLFISTLEEILKGNQALFTDCSIGISNYAWTEYPIIHFDFTQIPNKTTEQLEKSIERTLREIATNYEITINIPTLQEGLADLVKKLSQKAKVVVLVDEYDKPIIDNLNLTDTADSNRDLLRSFFGTLKGLDQHLKLVFITGVSKFAQVSLFSCRSKVKRS